MHGSKGQGRDRDLQANKTHWIGRNSGNCDGQLEVERRIREDQSNADSMPRPPMCAQVNPRLRADHSIGRDIATCLLYTSDAADE